MKDRARTDDGITPNPNTSTNVRRSLLEARSEVADKSKSRSSPDDSMPLLAVMPICAPLVQVTVPCLF